MQRHVSLISEVSDTVTEDDCDWAFDSQIEDDEKSCEEQEMKEFAKCELTREVQYNFTIMRLLNKATLEEIKAREVDLELVERKSNKTLVLDLDDTLIHMINPKFKYSSMNVCHASARTVIYKDQDTPTFNSIKIIIRPYALKLLEELSQLYEIVVLFR